MYLASCNDMLLAAYLDSLASSGNTQLAFVFTTLIVWDASANGVAAALMIISQKKTHYFLGKVVLFEVHIILIVVFLVTQSFFEHSLHFHQNPENISDS